MPQEQTANLPDLKTFCNPIDISYRFGMDLPSRREADDPTIILFQNLYSLFESKLVGYWYSEDMAKWTFVESNQVPKEKMLMQWLS